MYNIEALNAEEKELERKFLGTPPDKDQAGATGETDEEQKKAPTQSKDDELVTHKSKDASATDEPKVSTRDTEEDWEKRYKNLRNSRDTKLQEANQKLTKAYADIEYLQEKNDKLREEVEKYRANTDPLDGVVTAEAAENLGDDTVALIKQATSKAVEIATKDLKADLEDANKKLKHFDENERKSHKNSEYDLFIDRLSNIVPDWNDINHDPKFIDFCHKTQDLDGSLIADNFRGAELRKDATTIARYMLQYKDTLKQAPVNPLDEMAAPAGKTSGTPSRTEETGSNNEIVTKKEIDKFYADLSKGRYKGRQQEADETERRIEKAVMQGRVR